MPWIGPVVGGAVGLIGDVMSQQGQQSTNAMNMAMMQENQQWQQQMRDTAMQSRVADYKAAGLNPMLAAGGPGASMVSPVMPNLQNPAASFSQLGAQATNAIQTATVGSEINRNNAAAVSSAAAANQANVNAAKAAGVDTDTQRQSIAESQSRQGLMQLQGAATAAQANLNTAQVRVADATLGRIQAEIQQMGSATDLNRARTNIENINSMLLDLDIQQRTAIMPSVIQSAANAAALSKLAIPEGQAQADFWSTEFGKSSPALGAASAILKAVMLGFRTRVSP